MRIFTILDRYIIKKFLTTFFISIILIISIVIIIDLSEKLGDFIEHKVPAKEIFFKYYLNFIPYYTNLFLFLFVFIAIIFFTSRMAAKSEIIAMISSGISFNRLLFPYMFSAFVIAVLSFLLGNFIIPPSNKIRIAFENKYIYYREPPETRNIHKQIRPGEYLYIKFYDTRNDIGHIITLEKFKGKYLISKTFADNMIWQKDKKKWQLNNYYTRFYGYKKDSLIYGFKIDTALMITPEDIKQTKIDISTMNYFELNKYIENQKLHGNEHINEFLLEKHKRIAFPFSTFILTFIGVSLSAKKRRGGTGLNIGIGFALSFAYIFFMQITDSLATKGGLPPGLSAWMPNIIFGIIAILTYPFAPK